MKYLDDDRYKKAVERFIRKRDRHDNHRAKSLKYMLEYRKNERANMSAEEKQAYSEWHKDYWARNRERIAEQRRKRREQKKALKARAQKAVETRRRNEAQKAAERDQGLTPDDETS